ncbi:bud neck involved protein [Knufia peltigerae]|nr:bud neck involved protein [Knufia peltigerae]
MIGRPSSSGGYPSHASQGQMRNHAPSRYNNVSTTGYRGVPGSGPIAPYAFTSTPQLAAPNSNARLFAHNQGRSRSSPSSPPDTPTNLPQMDFGGRPLSLGLPAIPSTGSLMGISTNLAPPVSSATPKPSPDRYRRNGRRADGESQVNRPESHLTMPSGSGMAAVGSLYNHPAQSSSTPSLRSHQSYRGSHGNLASMGQSSADDLAVGKPPTTELAARYRRRSFGSIETAGLNHASDVQDASSPHPNVFLPSPQAHPAPMPAQRPPHKHTQSSDSVASSRSTHSSRPSSARANYANTNSPVSNPSPTASPKSDQRLGVRSPRSGDSSIRQPSPLSRPANLQGDDVEAKTQSSPAAPQQPRLAASPAIEQLAALNQKSGTKSKSKLRRAFSFGSAAELRKATTQGNHEKSVANKNAIASKRNSKYEDELEPEQARIAEKQEAAGLGESIYSGQGHFFTGSTDNLSISSTASSASVMLRKMGKGVKKGTRSLVGLFRPKSVVGVPAADGPVNQASLAQVSMVTVEAEREKVNVNVNPHDQAGGGTGFPKLERNSIETKLSFDSGTVSSDTRSRRSIVGGEKERAEVLAAVKKGILKRADSNQTSPNLKTYDFKVPDFNLPQIPHVNDSPKSSAPSTPADETPRSGHRRTDSITIESNDHDDYFSSMTRFVSPDTKETPMTPQSLMRNISFSPRLQFYDTWPSGEYDRRGEIATCNRLTPMLAQQIKEELNTFKMEMEVHESSKVYTHFF